MGDSSTPAPSQDALPRLFRFGVFEADPRSGELRRNGAKVRIQEQPFQILLMLLERPGEVVSREDLRQRLWSNDTFVDFDHGLNTAINKLRDALGDVANNPRFVETLARRGYRFIAPVRAEYAERGTQQAGATDQSSVNRNGTEAYTNQLGPDSPSVTPVETRRPVSASTPSGAATLAADVVAPEAELPRPARGLTRTLFMLVQLMYLIFYAVALARLEIIHLMVENWHPSWGLLVTVIVLVTGSVGIAIRLYLLAAAGFDYRQLGRNFRKMFPVILPLDQLWALASFFLLLQIGIGAVFAACAALLYLPFSQRTLVRMAYKYE
jgi:cholera toxin transcriptional activator